MEGHIKIHNAEYVLGATEASSSAFTPGIESVYANPRSSHVGLYRVQNHAAHQNGFYPIQRVASAALQIWSTERQSI